MAGRFSGGGFEGGEGVDYELLIIFSDSGNASPCAVITGKFKPYRVSCLCTGERPFIFSQEKYEGREYGANLITGDRYQLSRRSRYLLKCITKLIVNLLRYLLKFLRYSLL